MLYSLVNCAFSLFILKYLKKGENMYHVYLVEKDGFDSKKLLGNYKDIDEAYDRIDEELEKNPDIKYTLEETNGTVNNYGDLISTVLNHN